MMVRAFRDMMRNGLRAAGDLPNVVMKTWLAKV